MTNSILRHPLLAIFAFFAALPFASSQNDDHYWTHQYGAKGLLLNGAVIASTEDETAVFYNPGALGNGEDFGISVSFLTPTYSVLKTEGYLGLDSRADNRRLGFSSDLSAVGFRPFKSHRFRAAVTSFSRYKSGLSLREREVGTVENQPSQLFIGNLEFRRSVSERWFGGGMAFRINDNLSVGASQFFTFHTESTSLAIQKEIVEKDNPYELTLAWATKFKYSFSAKGGMLTKFGMTANWGNVKLGATVTTSTYHFFAKKASYDNFDLKVYGRDSTILISNLAATALLDYKTPWSFGLGADFKIGKTRASISTEYFTKIPLYTIIEDKNDPFNGLANGVYLQETKVQLQNRAVHNVAIGLQTQLRNDQSLIMGFRTDFNQRIIDQGLPTLSFLSTTPTVFHFSFGGLFLVRSNKLSAGLDYSFGRKRTTGRLADLTNITPENLFEFSKTGAIQSRYQSVVFIFTYDFILKSWKEWRRRRSEMKK
ncbi:MAG: hypothetical protein MUC59_09060 [Saprospiraceae bacterium]|nr:hypothetical protein [Saprospiraceae bacterium]